MKYAIVLAALFSSHAALASGMNLKLVCTNGAQIGGVRSVIMGLDASGNEQTFIYLSNGQTTLKRLVPAGVRCELQPEFSSVGGGVG